MDIAASSETSKTRSLEEDVALVLKRRLLSFSYKCILTHYSCGAFFFHIIRVFTGFNRKNDQGTPRKHYRLFVKSVTPLISDWSSGFDLETPYECDQSESVESTD